MSKTHEESKDYVSKYLERSGFKVAHEFKLPRGDGTSAVYNLCAIKGEEKYLIEVGPEVEETGSSWVDRETIAKKHGYHLCQWSTTKVARLRGDLLIRLNSFGLGGNINEAIEKLLTAYYAKRDPPKVNNPLQSSSLQLWSEFKPKIQAMIDISIEDARRG